MVTQAIETRTEQETTDAGRTLASELRAGDVLLLYGDLGAGKTAFVRGVALGLGAPEDEVSSPTFTLIQEYRGGRLPLFHVDLYRLSAIEAADLGLEELMDAGVLAIEWADRLDRVPAPPRLDVRISDTGEGRRIEVTRAEAPGAGF